jgi:hypothetical protein
VSEAIGLHRQLRTKVASGEPGDRTLRRVELARNAGLDTVLIVTIRRRDTTAGQPARRPLGHVAVSIDDLRALMDLLGDREDVDGPVVVEFDEGDFDQAEDMRELGPQNLRELRVKAGDLVVHLAENRAEAIGPTELTAFVYNAWARARQTPAYPASWGFMQKYPYKSPLLLFGLFAFGFAVYLFRQVQDPQKVIWYVVVIGLLLFMGWILYKSNKSAYDASNWAVIQPFTAHKIREAQQRKTTVPLWALIVTIIGLVITTTFLVLNYIKPGP